MPIVTDGPARLIVGYQGPPMTAGVGSTFLGAEVVMENPVLHFFVAATPHSTDWTRAVRALPNVRYVETDHVATFETSWNDPLAPQNYGPELIHMSGAWDRIVGEKTKAVCLLDTGVRYTHDDLLHNLVGPGQSFVSGHVDKGRARADPWDVNGHGTHVAGIMAARDGNGLGVSGVGDIPVMALQVGDSHGELYYSAAASGLQYCADHGGSVASMSFGGRTPDQTMTNAVNYAWSRGVLMAAASGNDGCPDCVLFPASLPNVIAVRGAVGGGYLAGNGGPQVGLLAPWAALSTCWDADSAYCWHEGTSMATPYVSAVAALTWGSRPNLTNSEMRAILNSTADDLGPLGHDSTYGYGVLNASAAVNQALEWNITSPSCQLVGVPMGATSRGTVNLTVAPLATNEALKKTSFAIDGVAVRKHDAAQLGESLADTTISIDTTFLSDGPHIVSATCLFGHGVHNATAEQLFVDNVPDPVATLDIVNGTTLVAGVPATIHVTVTAPGSGIRGVFLSISGDDWIDLTNSTSDGLTFSYPWDTTFAFDHSNLRVRVVDTGDGEGFARAFVNVRGFDTAIQESNALDDGATYCSSHPPSALQTKLPNAGACDPSKWVYVP